MIGWNREQLRQEAPVRPRNIRMASSRLCHFVNQLVRLAAFLPVLLMLLQLLTRSSNRERCLVGKGVERDEAIDMNAVVLLQADPVRLQLAHGLIAYLLRRFGLPSAVFRSNKTI